MEACDNLPSEGCKQCIKVLFQYKANTKVTDNQGWETALHIVIKRKPDLAVVKWLVCSWNDSVLDIPWATLQKRSQISNPISSMTRDAKVDTMMSLFLSDSYIGVDDDAKRKEIDASVAEVAKYFAKLGFVEMHSEQASQAIYKSRNYWKQLSHVSWRRELYLRQMKFWMTFSSGQQLCLYLPKRPSSFWRGCQHHLNKMISIALTIACTIHSQF